MQNEQPKKSINVSNSVFQWNITNQLLPFLKLSLDAEFAEILRIYETHLKNRENEDASNDAKQSKSAPLENIYNIGYLNLTFLDDTQRQVFNELYSLLPLQQQIEWDFAIKNAKKYFHRILFPRITGDANAQYFDKLLEKIDDVLAKALLTYLVNNLEARLMTILPTLIRDQGGLPLHSEQINPAACVALPENTMLLCSPNKQDDIYYIGFTKLHSCFGFKIQHRESGRQVLMHVANDINILPLIEKVLDMFADKLLLGKNFDMRIIGGFRDEIPNLKLDDSSRFLGFFLIHLMAYMQQRQCNLNLQSMDCFEQLLKFRKYNNEKCQDLSVGCLFNREDKPVFIHYPDGYQAYTTIGNAVLVDEPGKRFPVWSKLMLFMEYLEHDVVLIYNDVDPGFNQRFRMAAQHYIRQGFIRRIMNALETQDLVAHSDDEFVINILNRKLESWEKCYSALINKSSEPIMNHMIHLLNIQTNCSHIEALNKSKLPTSNLPGYIKILSIDKTFFNVLLKDGCIALAIRENINNMCADLICSNSPHINKKEILTCLNVNNSSLWHLHDEIKIFQDLLREPAALAIENNLLAQIRKNPEQVANIFAEWQVKKFMNEIQTKIINKIPNISEATIKVISDAMANAGIRLMPLLHERNRCTMPLSQLIEKLSACVKWASFDKVNENINKLIGDWIKEAKIVPAYSPIDEMSLQLHGKDAIIRPQQSTPHFPSK